MSMVGYGLLCVPSKPHDELPTDAHDEWIHGYFSVGRDYR